MPVTMETHLSQSAGYDLYENVQDEAYIKNIDARHATYKKVVEQYLPYFKDKDVLEVGCYYGACYDMAKPHVKSFTAIEPSKHACEYLKEKNPGIQVLQGNVDQVIEAGNLQGKLFDTIYMFDVIEHVPDPIAMIKDLHAFLKPGGYLLFSTINIESSLSIAMGPWWPWYMDMHYYYFSDRGYIDMLHRSGYALKKHAHFPYVVKAYYFLSKILSMANLPSQLPSFLERNLNFNVPIKMGDVVLIVGKKEIT